MLLTFEAEEIRLQVAHAAAARSPAAPHATLNLVKKGEEIYLVASGAPASAKVAHAAGFDPTRAKPTAPPDAPADNDDVARADFVEPITVESFSKPLASGAKHVRIVVRSTYINVLGGQPERATAPGMRPRGGAGMRGR